MLKEKCMRPVLKNQKGITIIEVLVAFFIFSIVVTGLGGVFTRYTQSFQTAKELEAVEKHFNFIKNLFSQNCDSFRGDRFSRGNYKNKNPIGADKSIPEITMKSSDDPANKEHTLFYSSRSKEETLLSGDSLLKIKEISLQKTSNEQALLNITFTGLKTFQEFKKKLRLYMTYNSFPKGSIKTCSLSPRSNLKCEVRGRIKLQPIYENKNKKGKSYYTRCLDGIQISRLSKAPPLQEVLFAPSELPQGGIDSGSSWVKKITDYQHCLCFVLFYCMEGALHESSSCHRRP